MDTPLYTFQKEGVRLMRAANGRVVLGDEVGLGKTLQSLYFAWRHLPDDPPGPIVVCVPAHLKINWRNEARDHLGIRVEVLYGDRCPPDKLPPHNPNQVFVINYDILTPPHWKKGTRAPRSSWLAYLLKLNPRLVIADEGHLLSNPMSARTRAVRTLARQCPRAVILTGTPIANKPAGLWSLLNIVRNDLYPSRFDFCSEFTNARMVFGRWVFDGAKALDVLHARLKQQGVLIRRRKEDVLTQLPEITYTVVPVEIDLVEYRRAEADYIAWLAEKSPTLAKSAARAEELSRLNGLKKLAGVLKAPAVAAYVQDFLDGTDRKFLLGAHHYDVTDAIVPAFPRELVELVNGKCSDVEKNRSFDRFNADPRCRLMVGNTQAMGTGWSCRSASDLGVCELPWVSGDLTQLVGRIHGLNRGIPGTAAQVRLFVAVGTIDETICKLLDTKTRWADQVIDGRDAGAVPAVDIYRMAKAAILARHARPPRRSVS